MAAPRRRLVTTTIGTNYFFFFFLWLLGGLAGWLAERTHTCVFAFACTIACLLACCRCLFVGLSTTRRRRFNVYRLHKTPQHACMTSVLIAFVGLLVQAAGLPPSLATLVASSASLSLSLSKELLCRANKESETHNRKQLSAKSLPSEQSETHNRQGNRQATVCFMPGRHAGSSCPPSRATRVGRLKDMTYK